ncbi:MAG: amidohydrolase family protein [Actinobacteria bacterium]|nr:amidohydrolase family protein [Actinomycetota bacterium]
MKRPDRLAVTHVRRIITGDLDHPVAEGNDVLIENGVFSEIGSEVTDADAILDAKGLDLWPGLVDSHVHPIVGDVSVMPHGSGWVGEYMNGGVTRMISAGELTMPGLTDPLTPEMVVDLACVTAKLYRGTAMGPKIHAGTLLLVPGLQRSDFERIAKAGGVCVKYIYYPFANPDRQELDNYRAWAHGAGLKVKLHCGGTSYRGGSVTADRAVFEASVPDIAGHLNGGPIPVTDEDARFIVESGAAFEIIMGGNLRLARDMVAWADAAGLLGSLLCGTDTPGGSGITPRAMLQLVAFLSGTCKLPPSVAVAAASGNVTRAHGIEGGTIAIGRPADFLLVGAVRGSGAATAEASVASGEIPGIGAVVINGEVRAIPGRLTPPPDELPQMTEVR